jgi:uncharacterized protein with beta-barrel porin domain
MPFWFVRRWDGAQFAERTTLLSPRYRATLLAGTAFTGVFTGAIVGYPQSALAACLGVNTASVTCDAADQAAAGTLATTFGGTTVVNVNPGAKIDTGGATAMVTAAGSLTFNNNDTTFGIRNNALNGVDLTNNFGAITYVGNADVTATNVAVIGINATAGAAGDVSITNNATVTGTAFGIVVQHTGTGAVLVTGTGTATGGTDGILVTHTGVGPAASTSGIAITGSGDVTSTGGTAVGAVILNAANASNILIDRSGTLSGIEGISAQTNGTGSITVLGNGLVTGTSSFGIAAFQTGNGAGTNARITIGGSGDVHGATGIHAEVQSTNNVGSVMVNRNGAVTATSVGIEATARGGGDVTVSGVGDVSSSSLIGISALASGGDGNVVVTRTGTVFGLQGGIRASAVGSGNVTVTTSQDVSGPQGGGINATAVDGRITVNVTGGTVSSSAAGFLVPGIRADATGTGGATITVSAGASVIADQFTGVVVSGTNNVIHNAGTIRGGGGIDASGSTTITNAGAIIGTLGTAVNFSGAGNTLNMLGPLATLSGQAVGSGTDTFRLAGAGTNSFDVSQIDTGWTLLDKTGTSNWTLTGTATYAGPVTINGGTLSVNGDLTSASSLTVNAGGTLGGNGIVGDTTINGGTLAPGNSIGTLTISSLTMTAASTYLVQVSGTSSDKTIVTGAANIAGKVVVDPLARVAATTTYTILTSAGTSGTFSAAEFLAANSFVRNARLSYLGNDVLLTVDPGLLSPNLPANANINQKNVAAGIDNALLAGANMPAAFNALFALTGSGLASALTQVSGESATASQQTTFDAMNQFIGLLTDPFITGRGDGVSAGGSPTGYAEESLAYAARGEARSKSERDAYAAVYTKAAAPLAQTFQQRWSVWAAGYGGSQTTNGDPGVLGSNDTRSTVYGTAVGADYRFSPNTIAGFALAGGGTNFSVNTLGSGRSDLFQAGAFVRHNVGPAYITGALAYGWQDVTTNRTVTVAGIDELRAEFSANAWSGRVEGGYRLVSHGFGITPYAAGQFTTFDLPNYMEQAIVGSNQFALAYNSKSVTDTRSELGVRTDKSFAMANGIFTLRGRLAWAHDYNPDRNVLATFQTLPGASFVVNGATHAADSALTTASAEWKWLNGWSAAATFEGEFSNVTRSYAGKGVVRYAW